ncbi:SDR family oxidoreductase [Pseudoclavibacter soli]|uniref:SDR family oxidoreductase n=1 Tax=Pseudoclavibacter soli TaxID=452623 RepID=UPI00041E743B|nr:SDR family oxidoreductase [Pseudoclavibacter soli]
MTETTIQGTPLAGKTVLITGSSRGIGAATAELLGALGATVVINYRDKAKRAEQVAERVRAAGGQAVVAQGDLTDPDSVTALFDTVRRELGTLDVLILNASGGMEKNVAEDYALQLNRDAQVRALDLAEPLLHEGSRVVFITSHQAHFIDTVDTLPEYRPVAVSKRAGEVALRARIPELEARGIDFVVVSGDMIVGTVTATLLNRSNPGVLEARTEQVGHLYSVEEFAAEIRDAVIEPVPADHIKLVGDTSIFTQS